MNAALHVAEGVASPPRSNIIWQTKTAMAAVLLLGAGCAHPSSNNPPTLPTTVTRTYEGKTVNSNQERVDPCAITERLFRDIFPDAPIHKVHLSPNSNDQLDNRPFDVRWLDAFAEESDQGTVISIRLELTKKLLLANTKYRPVSSDQITLDFTSDGLARPFKWDHEVLHACLENGGAFYGKQSEMRLRLYVFPLVKYLLYARYFALPPIEYLRDKDPVSLRSVADTLREINDDYFSQALSDVAFLPLVHQSFMHDRAHLLVADIADRKIEAHPNIARWVQRVDSTKSPDPEFTSRNAKFHDLLRYAAKSRPDKDLRLRALSGATNPALEATAMRFAQRKRDLRFLELLADSLEKSPEKLADFPLPPVRSEATAAADAEEWRKYEAEKEKALAPWNAQLDELPNIIKELRARLEGYGPINLCSAAGRGDVREMEWLVEQGVPVDARDQTGTPASRYALRAWQFDAVTFFRSRDSAKNVRALESEMAEALFDWFHRLFINLKVKVGGSTQIEVSKKTIVLSNTARSNKPVHHSISTTHPQFVNPEFAEARFVLRYFQIQGKATVYLRKQAQGTMLVDVVRPNGAVEQYEIARKQLPKMLQHEHPPH